MISMEEIPGDFDINLQFPDEEVPDGFDGVFRYYQLRFQTIPTEEIIGDFYVRFWGRFQMLQIEFPEDSDRGDSTRFRQRFQTTETEFADVLEKGDSGRLWWRF